MAFVDLTFNLYVDNSVRAIYWNGTAIAGVADGSSGNAELEYTISAGSVISGTNLLAFRLRDDGAGRSLFRGKLSTPVRVLYDYALDIAPFDAPVADPAVWTYTEEAYGTADAFAQPAFDDSAWSTKADPIGSGAGSSWTLGTDLLVRFEIDSSLLSVAEPGVWVDWAQDGFADGTAVSNAGDAPLARMLPQGGDSTISDNITDDVLSLSWWRGGSYDSATSQQPGGALIRVRNSDGKYSPDNTSSPLYGYLVPGLPVWCGADAETGSLRAGTAVKGVFAAYIREIVPSVEDGATAYCDLICDDPFGQYRGAQVSIQPSKERSHAEFREAVLDELDEPSTRRNLADENGMLPFSAVDARDALSVMEDVNRVAASRHFIDPADDKDTWYRYTTVNRTHKLTAAVDASIDGDDIDALSEYRVTRDTIINYQRASVSPIAFSPESLEVWSAADLPFTVTMSTQRVIWAEFPDYVFDAQVSANVQSGSYDATVTNFGRTARIVITALSPQVVFTSFAVMGSLLRRGDPISVVAERPPSQARFGVRAGPEISSDLIGQEGAAQGLVDYIVWRDEQPRYRPRIGVSGKNAASRAFVFERDVFDVIALSTTRLSVTNRRFEITGLRGSCVPDEFWHVDYDLQQTPNASQITTWFVIDSDSVDGPQLIAPF